MDPKEQLIRHDIQISRLISDAESEKGTRRRENVRVQERLDKVERIVWCGVGGLAALQIILTVWLELRK